MGSSFSAIVKLLNLLACGTETIIDLVYIWRVDITSGSWTRLELGADDVV